MRRVDQANSTTPCIPIEHASEHVLKQMSPSPLVWISEDDGCPTSQDDYGEMAHATASSAGPTARQRAIPS